MKKFNWPWPTIIAQDKKVLISFINHNKLPMDPKLRI